MQARSCALLIMLTPALVLPAGAAAQIPDEFHNLKVLPEDISQRELVSTMRGFTFALGARCQYCHVGEEGMPLSEFDFESDEKETKRKARFMLQMVQYLNDERLPGLTQISDRADPPVRVRCVTCHRGRPVPRTLNEELQHAIAADGIEAGVERYRELREEFYGTGSYDFSEQTLIEVASEVAGGGNMDAAQRLFELNLEFFPESWQSWVGIGQIHMRAENRDEALAALRRAEELAPENPFIKRMISQIEGGGP